MRSVCGWTENAAPKNGGPKKIKYLKMQDLKMKDQRNMTGREEKLEDKLPIISN